jgi:hypothetical protein
VECAADATLVECAADATLVECAADATLAECAAADSMWGVREQRDAVTMATLACQEAALVARGGELSEATAACSERLRGYTTVGMDRHGSSYVLFRCSPGLHVHAADGMLWVHTEQQGLDLLIAALDVTDVRERALKENLRRCYGEIVESIRKRGEPACEPAMPGEAVVDHHDIGPAVMLPPSGAAVSPPPGGDGGCDGMASAGVGAGMGSGMGGHRNTRHGGMWDVEGRPDGITHATFAKLRHRIGELNEKVCRSKLFELSNILQSEGDLGTAGRRCAHDPCCGCGRVRSVCQKWLEQLAASTTPHNLATCLLEIQAVRDVAAGVPFLFAFVT